MAEKEGKKRKRQSNGVEKPSKKVAVEGASTGNIKVTYSEEDEVGPVLVSTAGLTAPSIPFEAYAKPLSIKNANRHPRPGTHDLLLHSSKHPRVDYTASPIVQDQHLSHYIAIFDAATKTLQVTPAHHLSLRSVPRKTAIVDQDHEREQRASYAAQRVELGKEFGTKKAQKFIASRTENAIDKDSKGKGKKDDVQDAILESMADSTAATPKEDVEDDMLASKPIPKPNLAAGNVEDVYAFNTLIPANDARLIPVKDWQDAARADEPVNFCHRFPASRMSAIGKSDDTDKLKALRYLTLLLAFHDALQSGGRSAAKKVPKKDILTDKLSLAGTFPESLIDSVRRRFSTAFNDLPKWHLDNLYTHICCLSLYIDNWRTNTSQLREDLRMENKQLAQYFVELGAKVAAPTEKEREEGRLNKAQASVVRVARLRLPLEFPRPRAGRRR